MINSIKSPDTAAGKVRLGWCHKPGGCARMSVCLRTQRDGGASIRLLT